MDDRFFSLSEIRITVTTPPLRRNSLIGKRMKVMDNSNIVTKADKEAQDALFGRTVEITSEPFEEWVTDYPYGPKRLTFVYARSLDSGIEYRVMWNKSWLVKNDTTVPKNDVRGRRIILSDGSFSKEIGGTRKLWGIDKANMVIVSRPYVKDCTEKGDVRKYKYLFVDAYNLDNGALYSVLFNEGNLQPYEAVKVTVKVEVEVKKKPVKKQKPKKYYLCLEERGGWVGGIRVTYCNYKPTKREHPECKWYRGYDTAIGYEAYKELQDRISGFGGFISLGHAKVIAEDVARRHRERKSK